MRLAALLAAVCCAGAMNAAPPAFQSVNLPAGVSGQKILSTPDGGFLVLASSEVLRYSAAGGLISTWTAPGTLIDFGLDAQGELYVAGTAAGNVPIINSDVPAGSGAQNFFMKLDTSYSNVLVSARFGDSSTKVTAIAVDPSGNIYLGGSTSAATFPSAFSPGRCGNCAFAVKIPPAADQIAYSVLLGGPTVGCINDGEGLCPGQSGNGGSALPGSSAATALAVDANGSLTIAGSTFSDGFPIAAGAVGGGSTAEMFSAGFAYQNGFVTRLDSTGSVLIYSTCFGVSGYPGPGPISALGLTPDGNAVVAGAVSGIVPRGTIPPSGVFLATLNSTGTALISELVNPSYGSCGFGSISDLAVDSSGNTWITEDGCIGEVPPGGSRIVWASAFPGGGPIAASGNGVLALGANSVIYVPAPCPACTISGGVFNAISQQPESSVAPGEFVTVYGSNLGGATVDFNGVSAPILYNGPDQINVIAPWSLGSPMNVWVDGVLVKSIPLGVASANLQLLALVNADGTINSNAHPAPVGSTVTAFVNGASYGVRVLQDGTIATIAGAIPLWPAPTASSGLTITYQGSAPGELNEVQQVNLQVGSLPASSQATLTQANSTLKFNIAVGPHP